MFQVDRTRLCLFALVQEAHVTHLQETGLTSTNPFLAGSVLELPVCITRMYQY